MKRAKTNDLLKAEKNNLKSSRKLSLDSNLSENFDKKNVEYLHKKSITEYALPDGGSSGKKTKYKIVENLIKESPRNSSEGNSDRSISIERKEKEKVAEILQDAEKVNNTEEIQKIVKMHPERKNELKPLDSRSSESRLSEILDISNISYQSARLNPLSQKDGLKSSLTNSFPALKNVTKRKNQSLSSLQEFNELEKSFQLLNSISPRNSFSLVKKKSFEKSKSIKRGKTLAKQRSIQSTLNEKNRISNKKSVINQSIQVNFD